MAQKLRKFNKVLVANRSEIAIRVFRACTELGIKTVALYSGEDRLHLHRYKADEAYLLRQRKPPLTAYLDYEQIIEIALEKSVDAIHPGYGFLSENPLFAQACQDAGIVFIGPPVSVLEQMGDKVTARLIAQKAGVPVIPGTSESVENEQSALLFAKEHGFPLIIKAAMGGGGRGMTIVRSREELQGAIARSRLEAQNSFGNPKIFIERYLEGPKHIEIQILGDHHGNLIHLFERDCSIQRRHQKIIEIAPSLHLPPSLCEALYQSALKIGREIQYVNAGTVEFLVTPQGEYFFIEVNPRIQVEHTITEEITGIDLVQSQIRIAEGYALSDDPLRIPSQDAVKKSGYALQLRITTENPSQNFAPDTGKITTFRAGEGFGIRLDSGSGFEGAVISPHYDSLLIKVCAWALDFDQATHKALRAIREFRIRGVSTNIPFLENVLKHPLFLQGKCDTRFIEEHPETFQFKPRKDRANKLLRYLGELGVNGFKGIPSQSPPRRASQPPLVPLLPDRSELSSECFQIFQKEGAKGLAQWLFHQKRLFFTDTTFRDAHQSLIATRLRSFDMFRIASATHQRTLPYFSHEMWGGATFDVALRFLYECPWERLRVLRRLMPGTLLQMLIRSGNAVGYTNYPDNIVNRFIVASAKNGIDVFRIFDCLNWVEGLKPCIDTVLQTGKIAEASLCYSGDITDNKRVKFNLNYYVKLAKELEKAGTHILGIKDMAGLLKPSAARILITELRNHLSIPIHLHTHDTSGNGVATLLEAAKAGVHIVDACLSSMSGITSQPSLNAISAALQGTERDTGLDLMELQELSEYWEIAREAYSPFECGLKAGTADVYRHEIPGGQYSNYKPQAIALGLGNRWDEVKNRFRTVNDMLGEVIKVTPSSKAVGDMALFMVQNNLTPEAVLRQGKELAFPESFVLFMKGMMGQMEGGFPGDLQKAVLKNEEPITCRPGDLLPDFDFESAQKLLSKKFKREFSEEDLLSYSLYPQVFLDYCRFEEEYGNVSVLDTPTFFYGLVPDQENAVTIEEGKTLILKILTISELQADGHREVFFELNGRSRNVSILDRSSGLNIPTHEKADPDNPKHLAAPMPGKIMEIYVEPGATLSEGQKVLSTEAMKMLNIIVSPRSGVLKRLVFKKGEEVAPGDLLLEFAT
jgi:pyruvate carboxylase